MAKNNLKRASAGSRTIDDMFKRKKLSEKSAVSISTQSVVPAPHDENLPSSTPTTNSVSTPVASGVVQVISVTGKTEPGTGVYFLANSKLGLSKLG